jgi:hypothetical protein
MAGQPKSIELRSRPESKSDHPQKVVTYDVIF